MGRSGTRRNVSSDRLQKKIYPIFLNCRSFSFKIRKTARFLKKENQKSLVHHLDLFSSLSILSTSYNPAVWQGFLFPPGMLAFTFFCISFGSRSQTVFRTSANFTNILVVVDSYFHILNKYFWQHLLYQLPLGTDEVRRKIKKRLVTLRVSFVFSKIFRARMHFSEITRKDIN